MPRRRNGSCCRRGAPRDWHLHSDNDDAPVARLPDEELPFFSKQKRQKQQCRAAVSQKSHWKRGGLFVKQASGKRSWRKKKQKKKKRPRDSSAGAEGIEAHIEEAQRFIRFIDRRRFGRPAIAMQLQIFMFFVAILFLVAGSSPVSIDSSNRNSSGMIRTSSTHPADVEALEQFKAGIEAASISPGSCLASWDFDHDPCASVASSVFVCGIRCDSRADPMRVTEITLDGAGYRGTISPFLGNLSSLEVLDLAGNSFQGFIPDSLSNLRSSLLKLELSQNSILGPFPESLGRMIRLQYLSIGGNSIQGPIPASIGRLRALERLSVGNNRLTGQLPLSLKNMVRLLYLDASGNLLSGCIPAQLPPAIMELSLRNNSLQGALPRSLTLLKQLEVLDLSHNQLGGAVRSSWLLAMPALQQLNLAHNRFDAIVEAPNSFLEEEQQNHQLIEIDLSFNSLRGPLPLFFVRRMKRLTALSLGHNRFSGLIPIEYALKSVRMLIGAQPLMRLYLESNFLDGELPSPFLTILPGEVSGSLVGNCLLHCPIDLVLCQGGQQRSPSECAEFFRSQIGP